jgi:quercetin dioxygenase-like cupin family protein
MKRIRAALARKTLLLTVGALVILATVTLAMRGDKTKKEIVGFTPEQVQWFTPSYYKDGRQRARLLGDSSHGGAWVDRVKIPNGGRVLAHTHPHDEVVTVIEGTWYLGEGERFDSAKLKAYPAGSFIVIPAGVPHFLATKDSAAIVQVSGTGKFTTDYLEK